MYTRQQFHEITGNNYIQLMKTSKILIYIKSFKYMYDLVCMVCSVISNGNRHFQIRSFSVFSVFCFLNMWTKRTMSEFCLRSVHTKSSIISIFEMLSCNNPFYKWNYPDYTKRTTHSICIYFPDLG